MIRIAIMSAALCACGVETRYVECDAVIQDQRAAIVDAGIVANDQHVNDLEADAVQSVDALGDVDAGDVRRDWFTAFVSIDNVQQQLIDEFSEVSLQVAYDVEDAQILHRLSTLTISAVGVNGDRFRLSLPINVPLLDNVEQEILIGDKAISDREVNSPQWQVVYGDMVCLHREECTSVSMCGDCSVAGRIVITVDASDSVARGTYLFDGVQGDVDFFINGSFEVGFLIGIGSGELIK